MMQEKLIPFFPLQIKNKPHDRMQIVVVFLNWVWTRTENTDCIGANSLGMNAHASTSILWFLFNLQKKTFFRIAQQVGI
jgi:hypothetical protein